MIFIGEISDTRKVLEFIISVAIILFGLGLVVANKGFPVGERIGFGITLAGFFYLLYICWKHGGSEDDIEENRVR